METSEKGKSGLMGVEQAEDKAKQTKELLLDFALYLKHNTYGLDLWQPGYEDLMRRLKDLLTEEELADLERRYQEEELE